MLLSAEVVGDIPIVGPRLAGHVLATLYVLRLPATIDVGTYCCPPHGADDGGGIVTASAADLVTEYAADYAADNRARNVVSALDLFLLDPAALFGSRNYRVR